MTEAVRVLLVDDHTLVRAGLRALLESLPGVTVIGEGANGREGAQMAAELRPDIVFLDINMPELNGLDAAHRIARETPGVRTVMLSMLGNEEYVAQALRSGASGYLMKDAEAAELSIAIKAVMRGQIYLSPQAARHASTLAMRGGGPADPLTPRQREILQLLAEGASTKEIAQKLDLSARTVETHRIQIMDRLQIRDVPGLVKYAIRIGLIDAGD